MTPTPRERFDQMYNEDCLRSESDIWGLIEDLLEEARQEMKDKCLKCIPKETISSSEGQDGENGMIQLIRTSISSL